MPRLMSVSLTEEAVAARAKTVTRRLGWKFLQPGDQLTLCRKVMGRRHPDGTVDPLVRLADVEVVSVRREPLAAITPDDVRAEGIHTTATPSEWARWYASTMGCQPDTIVTRIEWRYLDPTPTGAQR